MLKLVINDINCLSSCFCEKISENDRVLVLKCQKVIVLIAIEKKCRFLKSRKVWKTKIYGWDCSLKVCIEPLGCCILVLWQNMVKSSHNWIILPLIQPQVANQQNNFSLGSQENFSLFCLPSSEIIGFKARDRQTDRQIFDTVCGDKCVFILSLWNVLPPYSLCLQRIDQHC